MNNLSVVSNLCQLKSASTYTVLQTISEGPLSSDPSHTLFPSWKRFAALSTQQPGAEAITTGITIPREMAIAAGLVVLKPKPLPEDYDARVESFLRFLDSLDYETADDMVDDTTVEQ
jgi:hypothetical protein